MATVQVALVNRALRMLGVLETGKTAGSDESSEALTVLNARIDAYRNDGLMCYAFREETLTLSNGTASYTLGTSGSPSLNTTRPLEIKAAWIVDSSNDYPVEIINDLQYAAIPAPTTSGDWPSKANYKASYPNGTLYVYPVPNATRTMKLLTQVPLAALALADTLAVPPGWEDFMAGDLALALETEYPGYQVGPETRKMVREGKASIKRRNMPRMIARSEVADLVGGPRTGNILSDTP